MFFQRNLKIYSKLSEIIPSSAITIKISIPIVAIAAIFLLFSITYDIITKNLLSTLKDVIILSFFLVIIYIIHTVAKNIYLIITSFKKLGIYQYPILRLEDFSIYIKKNVRLLVSKIKELLDEYNFILQVLNNIPELGIIIIDDDNNILYYNDFVKTLFNVNKDYIGAKITNLTFEKNLIDTISEGNVSKTINITLQEIEKSLKIYILNSITNKIVFINDITNLTNLENALSLTTSIISHEVNTPLTNIQLGLESLSMKTEIPKELDKIIFSNLNRLKVVISNITSLSNVIANKSVVVKRKFNLKRMIEILLENIKTNYSDKNLTYSLNYSVEEEFYNDNDKFNLILSNLIDNAFKFSKNLSEIEINVYYNKHDSNKICIEVSNETESGIPKDEIENIFDKFYRAQNSYSIKGKGLGLYITKILCDMLGMEIKATAEGKKVTFTVSEK